MPVAMKINLSEFITAGFTLWEVFPSKLEATARGRCMSSVEISLPP